jgi:hypothetical protein
MARGVQLGVMMSKLRGEIRDSQSVALGVNAAENYKTIMRRHQETLWQDYEWPFLKTYRDDLVPAGTRYQQYPAGLDFERTIEVFQKSSGEWAPISYGITPAHLNQYDSDEGTRADPIRAWQHQPDNNGYEVWPIPQTDTPLRFRGTGKLKPFIAETDVCTLDDQLIVLFAAAELLAARGAKDADAKLAAAQTLHRRLKGLQGAKKREPFVMGGAARPGRPMRYGIDYMTTQKT